MLQPTGTVRANRWMRENVTSTPVELLNFGIEQWL